MSGFMFRLRVHLEWRPQHGGLTFWVRRAPRHGDRVHDGGESGRLVRCHECSDGFLFVADVPPSSVSPDQEDPDE